MIYRQTTADLISRKLKEFEKPEDVLILFSAHSLPMSVVNRGDCYPKEVAASVDGVMKHLDHANPYRLVWQSRVGPLPWLGPETKEAIDGLKSNGVKDILLVPIAFTSDHIETLYELDLLYIKESNANGMNIKRTEALNVEPGFIQTLGSLVKKALSTNSVSHSRQFHIRCSQCTNPVCGSMRKYFA